MSMSLSKRSGSVGILVALSLLAATPALAAPKSLKIWIGSDKGQAGLAKVGEKFTKATGVTVVIEPLPDVASKFQAAAAAAPDIVITAHDRVGAWVAAGLLEPVAPAPKFTAQFLDTGWSAFTNGGKVYGYPLSVEAIGLIYNRDFVPTPPKTFEELAALDKSLQKNGKRAMLWDLPNPYYSFPLLAANGGYPFGRSANGSYVATDVGVNNAGALQGAQALLKLLNDGVLPKDANAGAAEAAMNKGEVAMILAGPAAWPSLKKAKINFGVGPIPSIAGKPAKAFIGVQGAMISRASVNKEQARELIEQYLLTMDGLKTLDADGSLGVTAHKEYYKSRAADPLLTATMKNVQTGDLVPSLPQLDRFWSAMRSALTEIAMGRKPPKEALDTAAARIKAP